MTRISCSLSHTTTYNEKGIAVDSVAVECSRCGKTATAYGESEASIKRCLVTLRQDCPRNENNYYEVTDK